MPGIHVDVAAVVHHAVLGGGQHGAGYRDIEEQLLRVGGDEVGQLLDVVGVGHVIHPHARVEVAAVDPVGVLVQPGLVAHGLVDVVGAEGALGAVHSGGVEVGPGIVLGHLGVGELGHQLGIGGIGDVDHVQVVHGLGALAGAGGENLLVVEGEALALVGGHQEAAAGQGQAGVGAGAGELAGEGALQLELADLLGPGDVGDVQDDEALAVVGQIGQVAHHERRPVELGPVHELPVLGAVHGVLALLQAVGELTGHPPAAHLHRVGGVDDVQDAVDVAGVARAVGGQV